jgi:hypothetical protein
VTQSAAISYLINIYGPTYGASASAGNAFARYVFAAAFPLFAVQSKHLAFTLCFLLVVVHGTRGIGLTQHVHASV